VSWRATIACTRAQAEALPDAEQAFPASAAAPVLVAENCRAQAVRGTAEHGNDPAKADEWLLHAYFDGAPTKNELAALERLGQGTPEVEQLPESDWVTISQSGLEVDAGLAFGTGQHATTAGCLEALDKLEREGARFANIADIGTGTGLLAFAALALWPGARCIATDIDPVAVAVARDNAAINGVKLGHGAGELLLTTADGMDSPLLAARAPFDLIVANILAGPLIELAPDFARALAPRGTVMLAGLLDTQADAVVEAYAGEGCSVVERGPGEWPVLVLTKATN
jgi:ribosomal protein L11 methyltransferase